ETGGIGIARNQCFTAIHPGARPQLVLASSQPLAADEEAQREPEDAQEDVAQQKLPPHWIVDLPRRHLLDLEFEVDPL
ncbi:MAG: hypothetical protein C4345_09870, partial [Chloroflexota bacterium]